MLLKYICKGLLKLIGWKKLDKEIIDYLNLHPYTLMIFSHTSYYDFLIMLLYSLSNKKLGVLKVLIKPQLFTYFGWLFRRLGGIPSTKIESKNGGSTNLIIQELQKYPRAYFLISPKGTILKADWRSGYYYIACNLKANLVSIGADYEKKEIVMGKGIMYNEGEEKDIKKHLISELQEIVPLYPERELGEIRKYDKDLLCVVSNTRLGMLGLSISSGVFGLVMLYKYLRK